MKNTPLAVLAVVLLSVFATAVSAVDPTIGSNPFSTSSKAGGWIDMKGQVTANGWILTNISVSYWPVGGGIVADLNNVNFNAQGQFPIIGGIWQSSQIPEAKDSPFYFVVDVTATFGAKTRETFRFGPYKATSSK
jgi:hypothetical protein